MKGLKQWGPVVGIVVSLLSIGGTYWSMAGSYEVLKHRVSAMEDDIEAADVDDSKLREKVQDLLIAVKVLIDRDERPGAPSEPPVPQPDVKKPVPLTDEQLKREIDEVLKRLPKPKPDTKPVEKPKDEK